jgi:hypothetical protein
MEDFVMRDRGAMLIRYLEGILVIIMGITWGFMYIDDQKVTSLLLLIVSTGFGLFFLFGNYRPEKAAIYFIPGGMKIKWLGRIRSRKVYNVLIENIRINRTSIIITLYSGKPLKLRVNSFNNRQKEKVYTFFTKYSSANGVKLIRSF